MYGNTPLSQLSVGNDLDKAPPVTRWTHRVELRMHPILHRIRVPHSPPLCVYQSPPDTSRLSFCSCSPFLQRMGLLSAAAVQPSVRLDPCLLIVYTCLLSPQPPFPTFPASAAHRYLQYNEITHTLSRPATIALCDSLPRTFLCVLIWPGISAVHARFRSTQKASAATLHVPPFGGIHRRLDWPFFRPGLMLLCLSFWIDL